MTKTFNFEAQVLHKGDEFYNQEQLTAEISRILGDDVAVALSANVTLGPDFIEYDRIVAHRGFPEDSEVRDLYDVLEEYLPDGVTMDPDSFVTARVRVAIPEDSFLRGAVND